MQDSKRDRQVKNRLLDYVGEGEGEVIWENSIEIYIYYYMQNRWPVHAGCVRLGTQNQSALGQHKAFSDVSRQD